MTKPIFLVGPTGVGKSQIAIPLAEKINAEIVSCDSMQVYRNMDIGTDKPTKQDQKKIKHYLIDIIDLNKEYNVGIYIEDAGKVIQDIIKRGKIPLVVGGTGLYIKALIDGLFPGPEKNEKIRQELGQRIENEGLNVLYEELKKCDLPASEKINPNDSRRIIRALEVYYITGKPISSFQSQWNKNKDCIIIGLNRNREELYEKIDKRVDGMLDGGLVEEVKKLLKLGLRDNKTAMQALGYKEIIDYLDGKYDLSETISLIKRNTRRFARRQLTWFNKDDRVKWFLINKDEKIDTIIEEILRYLR